MTYIELYKALSIQAGAVKNLSLEPICVKSNAKNKQPLSVSSKDNQTADTVSDSEGRYFTFPAPRLRPDSINKNELSEEEQLKLDYCFRLAKSALHEFKNLMREAGVDVSNFDVSITNNRLNFSKIPDAYRGLFETLLNNKLSAHSFKARGTHKALFAENAHTKYSNKPQSDEIPHFFPSRMRRV